MEDFILVTPGALRERWPCQDLRRKARVCVSPNRRVKAAGAVELPRALGVNLPETLNTLIGWYKQWFTREEVSPGPGTKEGSKPKAFRQRVSGK